MTPPSASLDGQMRDPPRQPPIAFDNSYARLPARFFARLDPTPVATPRLIKLNEELASLLGLDAPWLASAPGIAMLAGNAVPAGAMPIATAYAGHQFGGFVPQLGDGRAILLGEVIGRDGVRRDIQLKGSGPTPYSRAGDGRAALGPVLREYIVSEAMAALGVPTTRALAAVTTGEIVHRDRPLPGAVLTRVAQSHIRVGTFQFFAARGDIEGLRVLTDHVIARHYPAAADAPTPALALLEAVVGRQASLIAHWLSIGFIHGVMNTDNCQIAGETIDYGPCAFMDAYDPATVYSSIDRMGRYAFANQPRLASWNLARLAEALLPLLADGHQDAAIERANGAIAGFKDAFEAAYATRLSAKVGFQQSDDGAIALAQDLLARMAENGADFTLTFRGLASIAAGRPDAEAATAALFNDPAAFTSWAEAWRAAQGGTAERADTAAVLRAANPAFIPRNHLIEAAIVAGERGDFSAFETLNTVLAAPFDDQPAYQTTHGLPPRPEEVVQATFCGT